MKITSLFLTTSIAVSALTSLSVAAINLDSLSKSSSEQIKTAAKSAGIPLETNAMIQYAAKQLNLSESTVSASFGSLLKVAKDNLSEENFALISKAVPDTQTYLDKAPTVNKSSMSSLFSNTGEAGKKAESAEYLTSAFNKLGISSDKIPSLLNTFSGYLEKSGYSDAAEKLKQAVNFI